MKNGLNKSTLVDGLFEQLIFDVWDVTIKKIVFTGSLKDVVKFTGCTHDMIWSAYRHKGKTKKVYAIRRTKEKPQQ